MKERLAGLVAAGLFFALHIVYIPRSLEDLDSINFALGVRDYDVAHHQPHPPGYPLYIAAAKVLRFVGLTELQALFVLAVLGGTLAVVALAGLLRRLFPPGSSTAGSSVLAMPWLAAVGLVALNPLMWITASRPLSDTVGLGAALAVQWMLVRQSSRHGLIAAALAAGVAAGLRSQVVWLTLPLLAVVLWRTTAHGRWMQAGSVAGAYLVGVLVWAVPLVVATGGPAAYWHAVFDQGAEDLSGVLLLANTPTPRVLVLTLRQALVEPWGHPLLAAAVLVFAALGGVTWVRRTPSTLMVLTAAYLPYAAFDLLFQEAITTRYALPLVIPVACLAVAGASSLPRALGTLSIVGMVGGAVLIDDGLLYAYAGSEAPVFRLFGDMRALREAERAGPAPVLAMHRRLDFDLRRPLQWAADALPAFERRLGAPAKHEWLEVVNYWNAGGRAPIWFLADPVRSDLALFSADARVAHYGWFVSKKALVGGARPGEIDWHRLDPPNWYLGQGWALTPETAGLAREDGVGPAQGGSVGWVRRWPSGTRLMIGGRHLGTHPTSARLRLRYDGRDVVDMSVAPGFFLTFADVPPSNSPDDYVPVMAQADSVDVAVEQFDAVPDGRLVWGYGEGWNEPEYNPATGVSWRWTTDRASLRVRADGRAAVLRLVGALEEASSSHVTIRGANRVVAEFDVDQLFDKTVIVPAGVLAAGESSLTIESSASYVPRDTRWRSQDGRRLGLKVFECSLSPVS